MLNVQNAQTSSMSEMKNITNLNFWLWLNFSSIFTLHIWRVECLLQVLTHGSYKYTNANGIHTHTYTHIHASVCACVCDRTGFWGAAYFKQLLLTVPEWIHQATGQPARHSFIWTCKNQTKSPTPQEKETLLKLKIMKWKKYIRGK